MTLSTSRCKSQLEIHALSRNAGLRAGFITMRQEALAHLAEIAESLPEGSDLRRQVLEYVLRVYNVELGELRTRLRDAGHTELEALVGTIADTLIKQGIEQGEARGLLKGEAHGAERKGGDTDPPSGEPFRPSARRHPQPDCRRRYRAGGNLVRCRGQRPRPGDNLRTRPVALNSIASRQSTPSWNPCSGTRGVENETARRKAHRIGGAGGNHYRNTDRDRGTRVSERKGGREDGDADPPSGEPFRPSARRHPEPDCRRRCRTGGNLG